jgi:hypothetical protein
MMVYLGLVLVVVGTVVVMPVLLVVVVVALVNEGRVADVDVVLVFVIADARYPRGRQAPDQIGCGPAMAVDAPFISRPIGVETMFLFDVTWRPPLPAARQLR